MSEPIDTEKLFEREFPPRLYVHFFSCGPDLRTACAGPYFAVSVWLDPALRLEVVEAFTDGFNSRRFTLAVYDGTHWRLCGREDLAGFEHIDINSLPAAEQAETPR